MMKQFFSLLIILLGVLLFVQCDENEPEYTLSTPEAQRNVLIEEFTGVRCVNCPAGSKEIENLKSKYGENLVAVSIHAGFFADPYPTSDEDLKTEAGETIQDYLGQLVGYPAAVVNRSTINDNDELFIGQGEWAGAIMTEASTPSIVNINIEHQYDSTERSLNVTATVVPVETSEEPWYLTAMITEDSISDTQLTPDGKKENYIHKHVLRSVLSATLGDPLPDDLAEGEQAEKSYSMTLPDHWKEEDCNIVVFIHHKEADKSVLQVEEVPLLPE